MTAPLDPAQHRAATGSADIQLVLAGPGSGKTTTLVGRFAHLVGQGVDRRRILALTFTRKAADEMKSRIATALGLSSQNDITVATFHGYSFRLLRRNPQAAGLDEQFQLWDTLQQRHVFSSRKMWWNEDDDILDIIGGAKERLLDAETFAAEIDPDDEVLARAVAFFKVYERALSIAGAIDFADMVPRLVRGMDRNHDYAASITSAYDHVLVDEYQDINPGQALLIDRFVQAGVKLWAVGDDDQTLYAFRAADVRYILEFTKKYRGAKVHVLDRNYRSIPQIVGAAQRLIKRNQLRCRKDYTPVITAPGELLIRGYRAADVEARQVALGIAQLISHGYRPKQIAVLYRTGTVGLMLQPALQNLQIPYEVRGAGDLWQSAAARLVVGALFYLREGESADAMSRMGTGRRPEIVRSKLDAAGADARKNFAAACNCVGAAVKTAMPNRASDRDRAEWGAIVEAVMALAASCRSLNELAGKIAEQSSALRKVPENAVVLSTIHSAKGLEWDAVFLVGMEQGVLPHANNDDVEEERRVAYVGLTRAKRIAGLTFSTRRFGQPSSPSQFLEELAGQLGQRHCVWTEPNNDSDDRLPLLSNHEHQRQRDGLPPEQWVALPKERPGAGKSKKKKRPSSEEKEAAQITRNQASGKPRRHQLPWGPEEDARLRAAFDAGQAIATIATAHERKSTAITARLIGLGLITEDGVVA